MKMQSAGRMERIGYAALAFTVAILACGGASASDVERQIPVIRDSAGSGLTVGISREGTRQTATPSILLNDPTSRRIEDRIVKNGTRLMENKTLPGARTADLPSPAGLTRSLQQEAGKTVTSIASLPPVPGEITIRSVKGFLKSLRSSRKEKQEPAVVVPAPELRLGRAN